MYRTLVPSYEGHIKKATARPSLSDQATPSHPPPPPPTPSLAPPPPLTAPGMLLQLGRIIVPVCNPRLCLGKRCLPTLGQGRVPLLEGVEGDDTLHCH